MKSTEDIMIAAIKFSEMTPDEMAVFFNWLYVCYGTHSGMLDECLRSDMLLEGGKTLIESFLIKK